MAATPVVGKRNAALVGHGGAGKTTLAEAIFFSQGLITRMGKIQEGNTLSDYTQEEIKREHSIYSTVLPLTYRDHQITILDTPGYLDFVGQMVSALSVVDGAVICVNGATGVESQTVRAWEIANEHELSRIVFINQLDRSDADFRELSGEVREVFGKRCVPLVVPAGSGDKVEGVINILTRVCRIRKGKETVEVEVPSDLKDLVEELRFQLVESIVELDEKLFERYLADEVISDDELAEVLRRSTIAGEIVPVIGGAAQHLVGVTTLLNLIVDYLPAPDAKRRIGGYVPGTDKKAERPLTQDAPFAARVFKMATEPHLGEMSYFRIYSGKVRPGDTVLNANTDTTMKLSAIVAMRGKERRDLTEATAGDIVATVKLKDTHIGDTLCAREQPIVFPALTYPKAVSFEAIEVEDKAVLEKISSSLQRLHEEDPTLVTEMNEETRQLVVYGMGELHLAAAKEKVQERNAVKFEWTRPRIPYKETIRGKAEAQGRYKKQTGGRGQYGDVWLRLEPYKDGELNFVNKIVGGVVPSRFVPAVEKGVRETMRDGVLAGYPVTNVQVTLYDGSHHSVDSSELAFKIAASLGFKKAFAAARPVLLEPIYHLKIFVPDEFVGDVMGDLNSRRGRVQGITDSGRMKVVEADVPLAEVYKYINTLRSLTQGMGHYEMEFDRYEEMPAQLAAQIIADSNE